MDTMVNSTDVVTSAQQEYEALRHVSAEFPCSYLPGRMARHEAYHVGVLDGASYEKLMARGFRRSGSIVYRPRCRGCHECRPLRVLASQFKPTHSMRRVQRRNRDIRVETGECRFDQQRHKLFVRYLDSQHDCCMSRSAEAFADFLCSSPTDTFEFRYFLGGRLVGVGVADRVPNGISSVYMYFDPDHASRSLGTFSILQEIEWCRRHNLPYYYLGYMVLGCRKMNYKARFAPCEVLVSEQCWLTFPSRSCA